MRFEFQLFLNLKKAKTMQNICSRWISIFQKLFAFCRTRSFFYSFNYSVASTKIEFDEFSSFSLSLSLSTFWIRMHVVDNWKWRYKQQDCEYFEKHLPLKAENDLVSQIFDLLPLVHSYFDFQILHQCTIIVDSKKERKKCLNCGEMNKGGDYLWRLNMQNTYSYM